jgi:hypothetical protein
LEGGFGINTEGKEGTEGEGDEGMDCVDNMDGMDGAVSDLFFAMCFLKLDFIG